MEIIREEEKTTPRGGRRINRFVTDFIPDAIRVSKPYNLTTLLSGVQESIIIMNYELRIMKAYLITL